MKEEIIEYYFGDIITPLGRPLLVIVGQKFEEVMCCEKFIFFEENNGKHTRIGEKINSSTMAEMRNNLEKFVKKEGLDNAKSIMYHEAYKVDKKSTYLKEKIKKINLRKSNQNAFLLYMKRKSDSQLDWIKNNTESKKLQEIIELYKSFCNNKLEKLQ